MLNKPFAGISPRNLFTCAAEWHAFVQGASEALPPWKPRHPIMSETLTSEIHAEHHYYQFGRTIGFLLLITTVLVLIALITCTPVPPGPVCAVCP